MRLDDLLLEVSQKHFPRPPATLEQIVAFEQRMGWWLDPDFRAFYLHCDGAELFDRPDSPYRFLPLAEIARGRVAIFGEDSDKWGPTSWYAVCDVQDGNYVMIDVSQQPDGRYVLLDGFHEAFPDPEYCKPIASGLSEFLEGALRSGGRHYWLVQGR